MTNVGKRLRIAAALALLATALAPAQASAQIETITTRTAAMQKLDGFVPLYWSAADGRLYLEISRFDTELLYQTSLATGVGSNPIGLDRGQLGATYFLPTVVVPLLLITHGLVFRLLLRGDVAAIRDPRQPA